MFLARSEYDRGVNTFSPEGRLFQVEYSLEAIKLGSTAIGVATGDGVLLGVEKRVTSSLLEASSVEKIVEIDRHIGCAMSGLQADARSMVEHARVESQNHSFHYNEPLRVESCTQAICDLALRFGEGAEGEESIMSRPFGVALLIAGIDEDGPQLYHAEPSGTFYRYDAKAIGSGSEGAQDGLQKEYHKSLTLAEAETLVLKTLKQVMEEKLDSNNVQLASVTRDKGFRIYSDEEMSEIQAHSQELLHPYPSHRKRLVGGPNEGGFSFIFLRSLLAVTILWLLHCLCKMRFTFVTICLTLLAAHSLAQDKPKDLTDVLNEQKNLTEFTTLLTKQYGDIYANLSFQDQVTILAPNNGAFAKIPYSTLGPAFENNQSDIVRSVLQYHIIPGLHRADSYNSSFSFTPSWLSNSSYTNVTGGQVVGGVMQAGDVNIFTSGMGSRSTLLQANLAFTGGIIHVIDTFLAPPADFISTVAQFNLTAAGGAATNASLSEYLNTGTDLTLFVPNNDAFQKLGTAFKSMPLSELSKILDYHVINGTNFVGYSSNLPNGTILKTRQGGNLSITFASNSLFVNSARVLQEDILLSNGVMHVIDNILDYNATDVKPVPAIQTQPPVIQGESISGNVLPYASDLPTSVSSSASATPSAGASSFGITDIGSGATNTAFGGARSSSSSTTSGGALQTGTSTAVGDRVYSPGSSLGGVFGAIMLGAGFL